MEGEDAKGKTSRGTIRGARRTSWVTRYQEHQREENTPQIFYFLFFMDISFLGRHSHCMIPKPTVRTHTPPAWGMDAQTAGGDTEKKIGEDFRKRSS
jgi:hypothetical protein